MSAQIPTFRLTKYLIALSFIKPWCFIASRPCIDTLNAKCCRFCLKLFEKFRAETVELAKVEGKTEADRIMAAAKAEVAQEVARAREQLRNHVAGLAVIGAEKILQREIDAKAHAELLAAIQREI